MRRLLLVLLVAGGAVFTVLAPGGFSAQGGGTCVVAPVVRDSAVNQGVSGTAGYTPLVRGKDTIVRFYLSGPSCGTTTFQLTSATLQLKNGTANIGAPVTADPAPSNLTGNFPAIATYSTAAVSNDTPGDAKFLVPGFTLNPCGAPACTNTASFTATFAAALGWRASTGATGTLNATVSATVDQKTNALRILVVKMGDLTNTAQYGATQFPLFGADAQATVQNAISGTLSRTFPVPGAPDPNSPTTSDLARGLGGIRYSFNITANCAGLSATCGMLDLARLTDSTNTPLVSPTRRFCLNGTTFGIIQPQLTNVLNAWNAANPGSQADRVLGVVDGSISDQTCALGMAGFGTPQAVIRVDPSRNNNGATLVMEMAHTLGAVPSARSSVSSLYHSPNAEPDTGLTTADPNAGTNRSYNTATRTYLSTDRTAMRVVDANWTDNNVDLEAKDYALLRCMLGGTPPTDTTVGCAQSGATGTGTSVAADSLFVSGSLSGPSAAQADVTESYLQVSSATPAPTVGTDNGGTKYYLVERNGTSSTNHELPVSCDTSLHDGGGGTANTSECYFDAAVAFGAGATSFEIWRGTPGATCTVGSGGCLYKRSKATSNPTTTVTQGGGGGGSGVGVQTTWVHDTLHNGSLQDASTDNAFFAVTHPDGAGNIYAAGYVTDCFNTPALAGCSKDIAVQKIDGNGNVLWTSHGAGDGQPIAGDPADDYVNGIALGPNGVYIAGTRQASCNGISDPGTLARCPAGGQAAFVAGLNKDNGGNLFLHDIDGPGTDIANGISYGEGTNLLYVAGGAQGGNTINPTITTPTAFAGRLWQVSPTDGSVLATRISAAAIGWTGVTTAGGSGTDAIYLTGNNVDAVAAQYTATSGGLAAHPTWISHFGSSVSNCKVTQDYSIESVTQSNLTFVNHSGEDVRIFWLGFDGNLEQYPTGFANNVLPNNQQYTQPTWNTHPWVAITSAGRCAGYTIATATNATYTIGAAQAPSDVPGGIAHAGSSVFVTGHTTGQIPESSTTGSAFVTALADSGDGIQWAQQFGANQDSGNAVAANNFGVYVAGSAANAIGNAQNHGNFDAFLVHYDPNGNLLYATEFPTAAYDQGHGVSLDSETGDIFVAGETQGKIDFDPGANGRDGFVARFQETTQDGTGGNTEVSSSWPTAADATNARLDVYYTCQLPGGGEIPTVVNYPVALGLTGTISGSSVVFTVPTSTTDRGCTNGTMKLVENNGFTRVDVTPTTPIPVANTNTAPVASISNPKDGSHWLQYQTIPAFGVLDDAEDGSIRGTALHWTLSGPGGSTSATGDTPTFGGPPNGLTPGAYTLTLVGQDSGGLSSNTATLHFTVDPDANNDWIPPVSCISDTTPGVAFGDADGDHIPNIDDARPCTPDTQPDTTPPTISVTGTNNANGTTTYAVTASDVTASTTDVESGLRSVSCTVDGNPAVGLKDTPWAAATFSDTFTETATGSHAVVCTATDLDYNTATASLAYTFSGFLQPIDNPPTVNTGSAGKTYPVKWQLTSPTGTSLGDPSLIKDTKFKSTACGTLSSDPTDALETTTTASAGLRFDGSQWIYNWKTPSTKGCYTFFLLLSDGTTRQALFNLK